LSLEEVTAIVTWLQGEHRLFARLLYGTGMRINEALQLRVKDIDFAQKAIIVRHGKGGKDRVVMLPNSLESGLREQLTCARTIWETDQADGRADVFMPYALERKYPRAGSSWSWFWVFPQATHSVDPQSGVVRRHHMYDQTFQRAFKKAVHNAGIHRPATPHTLRHSFATQVVALRLRHPHCPGVAWAYGCCHDDDLHPRPQAGRQRGAQPRRCHGGADVDLWRLSPDILWTAAMLPFVDACFWPSAAISRSKSNS
jgi:integrase